MVPAFTSDLPEIINMSAVTNDGTLPGSAVSEIRMKVDTRKFREEERRADSYIYQDGTTASAPFTICRPLRSDTRRLLDGSAWCSRSARMHRHVS